VRRRDFIAAFYCSALGLPCSAAAQQAGKVWRIGHVLTAPPERGEPFAQALERSLADLGYVQGRNIVLLHRFAGAQMDKIEEAVVTLLPQIDLLVVWGNAGFAAQKLAGAVPTVFISIGFPVELGLVQSLSHPGGNMTGIAAEAALEINGKRLQILKEIVPGLDRVAVLRDVADQMATGIGMDSARPGSSRARAVPCARRHQIGRRTRNGVCRYEKERSRGSLSDPYSPAG